MTLTLKLDPDMAKKYHLILKFLGRHSKSYIPNRQAHTQTDATKTLPSPYLGGKYWCPQLRTFSVLLVLRHGMHYRNKPFEQFFKLT